MTRNPTPVEVPAALDAEASVLGAILVDASALETVRPRLKGGDFYRPANRLVYETASQLAAQGSAIDIVTMSARLESEGMLQRVGGAAYLSSLESACPLASNVLDYADLVREAARKRDLLHISDALAEKARNGVPAVEAATAIRTALGSLDFGDEALVVLDGVEPEAVEWLWPGRYPVGKLTTKDGDPGRGKSIHTCEIVACLTSCRAFPDGHERARPVGCVVLNAEDGLTDTIVPRLIAAGADLRKVVTLERPLTLPEELTELERAIRLAQRRAGNMQEAFVSIDPLAAYLSGRVDTFKDHDVRRALAPLAQLAGETNATIELTRHLSKRIDLGAMYRGGGSIGIIGAARVGTLIAEDPDDPGVQVVACIKNNLAAKPRSLRYRIEAGDNGAPRLSWLGESEHTAESLSAAAAEPPSGRGVDILRTVLAGGPLPAAAALAECERQGLSGGSLDRAKRKLRVQSEKKPGTFGGPWYWRLPGQEWSGGDRGSSVPFAEEHQYDGSMEGHRRTPKDTEDHQVSSPAHAREGRDPDDIEPDDLRESPNELEPPDWLRDLDEEALGVAG